MPIYEYRCENGHLLEIMQKITDDPVTHCEECGASVQRVFHPIAVHFKGSGFYNTDYGKQRRGSASDDGSSSGGGEKKSESSGDSKKTETSTSSTSSSSSSSSSSD